MINTSDYLKILKLEESGIWEWNNISDQKSMNINHLTANYGHVYIC